MPVTSRTHRYGSPGGAHAASGGGGGVARNQGVAPPVKHNLASTLPGLARTPSLHSLLRGQSPAVGTPRYNSPSRRGQQQRMEGLASPHTPHTPHAHAQTASALPLSPRVGVSRQSSFITQLRNSPSSPRFTPMQLSRNSSVASSAAMLSRTTSFSDTYGHESEVPASVRKFTPGRAPSPLSHSYTTPTADRRRAMSASSTRRGTAAQSGSAGAGAGPAAAHTPVAELPSLASSTSSLLKGLLDASKTLSPRHTSAYKPSFQRERVVATESPPVAAARPHHTQLASPAPAPVKQLPPTTSTHVGGAAVVAATTAKPAAAGRKVPSHISNMVCSWTANGQEDQAKYGADGYMRLKNGMVLDGRYHVISKLGWGEFATVWLCWDQESLKKRLTTPTSQFVAVKVSKCADHVSNAAHEEANLLKYVGKNARGSGAASLATVLGVFTQQAEHGAHVCMVFPVLGQNILCLVEQAHRHRNKIRGISNPAMCPKRPSTDIAFVKSCMRATLRGLNELSKHNIVHTDLKPENILLTTVSQKTRQEMRDWQDAVAKLRGTEWDATRLISTQEVLPDSEKEQSYIRVSDFGLSSLLAPDASQHGIGTHARRLHCRSAGSATNPLGVILQTREYRAPEVLFGNVITPATDVWSVGCMAFELITGTFLMDPKKDPKRRVKDEDEINCDHISMMQQLIGPVPVAVAKGGGKHLVKYFDDAGRFVQQDKADKYFGARNLKQELMCFIDERDAALLGSFIVECLGSYDATRRTTAEAMLKVMHFAFLNSPYEVFRIIPQIDPDINFFFTQNCSPCR